MDENESLALARRLMDSVAGNPVHAAGALTALAAFGSLHPLNALAATACGAALLARRYRGLGRDALGRSPRERTAMERGFTLRLGTEARTGRPLVLSEDEARQHLLVMGTTGSDKTSFLLGLSEQAIAAGSGLLFVDGKGDVSLFAKVFTLARRHGRLDDLLVLNLMTGNADVGREGGHLLSNTLNPFAVGSADNLTQLVVSLMDEVGGDGALWKGRATALFTGLVGALVWLRDNDGLEFDIPALRDHLGLRAVVGLASGTSAPGLPNETRLALASYLKSLPGYNPERGERQAQATLDQHGYLEMIFTQILGSLAYVYGHVFRTRLSDIDMQDVVLNRRILVVMLPALEKSCDELANLGKIVLATLKGMMGGAFGNRITGSCEDIGDKRVATSDSPFLCVLDEIGYYAVEGLALMAAQARALGFSMVYGSQDIPAMRRLNEKEAASIIANTNTKVFLRLEEMETTSWRARMGWFPPEFDAREYGHLPPGEGVVFFKGMKVHAEMVRFAPDGMAAARAMLRANHLIPLTKSVPGADR